MRYRRRKKERKKTEEKSDRKPSREILEVEGLHQCLIANILEAQGQHPRRRRRMSSLAPQHGRGSREDSREGLALVPQGHRRFRRLCRHGRLRRAPHAPRARVSTLLREYFSLTGGPCKAKVPLRRRGSRTAGLPQKIDRGARDAEDRVIQR